MATLVPPSDTKQFFLLVNCTICNSWIFLNLNIKMKNIYFFLWDDTRALIINIGYTIALHVIFLFPFVLFAPLHRMQNESLRWYDKSCMQRIKGNAMSLRGCRYRTRQRSSTPSLILLSIRTQRLMDLNLYRIQITSAMARRRMRIASPWPANVTWLWPRRDDECLRQI